MSKTKLSCSYYRCFGSVFHVVELMKITTGLTRVSIVFLTALISFLSFVIQHYRCCRDHFLIVHAKSSNCFSNTIPHEPVQNPSTGHCEIMSSTSPLHGFLRL